LYHKQRQTSDVGTSWWEVYHCPKAFDKILESGAMVRLKGVDQSGPPRYLGNRIPAFSRFEHSVGVAALLEKAGAPLKEQIAGLLHDASHTVFSHVGDYIFAKDINDNVEDSYQDKVHLEQMQKSGIQKILKEYDMDISVLNVKPDSYPMLEQQLPDMCADRIQYNIHTGVICGLTTKIEAKAIIDDIRFSDGKWFFTDPLLAAKFANLSLQFTEKFWGAKWNTSMNIHFAMALKRALHLKIIQMEDLFTTDDVVLKKLKESKDQVIVLCLKQCEQPTKEIPGQSYDEKPFKPKFRGIDPLIKNEETEEFRRLSEIDQKFKNSYEAVKKWCQQGYNMAILSVQ
jgi:HD superfamily phosphohydrolase